MSGCGAQTEEANELIAEADEIVTGVQPKLEEVESLLAQAGQLAGTQAAQESTVLTQAQALIDEIVTDIGRAKEKIDEAAALNISDNNREYLEAKSSSMDAFLDLTQTMRQLTEVLLADPAAQNPVTLQQWAELGQTMSGQIQKLQEAEAAAGKILEESGE
jgi:hypothetical protein